MYCLLLTLILLMTSCQSSHPVSNATNQEKKTLRINFQEGDPPSLHPHQLVDLRSRSLGKALYEGLTRVSPEGIAEPAAAAQIDISEERTRYTFTIRKQLWSNGAPLTAWHFQKAWKQALSPHSSCLRPDLFYPIKNAKAIKEGKCPLEALGVEVVDDETLVVTLEHHAPYFLDLLTHPIFSPLYDDAEEPHVFNGPFLPQEWVRNVSLHLVKNETYWDKEPVQLDAIIISMITDSHTSLALYEKEEIDWVGNPFSTLPLDAIPHLTPELHTQDVTRTYWIYLNTEFYPLSSSKIRKALAYAVNRRDLAEHVLCGQTPHRSPVPNTLSLLHEEDLYPDGDISLAQTLFEEGMEELGLTKETFPPLILSHSDVPGQKTLAQALQETWHRAFGIAIELNGFDWNTFFSYLSKRQYHMGGCIRSSLYNDPIYHLEILKDKENLYNASAWENPEYKALLDRSDHTCDPLVRKELLKQAEKILIEEMPVIPLHVDTYRYLVRETLENISCDHFGGVDFKWTTLKPLSSL